ncbi:hypothetical protein H6Y62_01820 [Staphylococcus lugdunensis]|jgi:amino acid transporter|uniref:DUF3278 domain-containing protein n=2 Tax=Staphylococcus lugdunensis TaxID=28035 RepID=A0A292DJQ1_STALU|nr:MULTISPECIES: hypothetical protein [Staphylococcus]ADC86550.1 hypothetical protein SLGD_00402 [Staphylococcus lugdunensis HKU09-01]AMG62006.1 hypothetical protein AL499_08625 [Staphylococcus lugdunensis]ARB76858.1 hypothetical protein A6J61_00450 [Staphylococcus lugdunensis]ARJ08290.1 hypothetical protein B7454_02505 [Staphylococcus lugdunensis]ARJ10525.1 hypothetical protein B7466_01680 [Staphylococcus lugdunensis]
MNKFKNKMINSLLGTIGDKDEREIAIINAKFTTVFLTAYVLLFCLLLLGVILDAMHDTISVLTMAITIVFLIINIQTLVLMRKEKLDDLTVYSDKEYVQLIKKLKRQSVVGGFFFGALTTLFDMVFRFFNDTDVTVWFAVSKNILPGLVFGVLAYFFAKSKVRKDY